MVVQDAQDFSKKQKRIMRSFKMLEISAVDRPAQPEAKAVIMKRQDDTSVEIKNPELNNKILKFLGDMILTTAEDGHQHSIYTKEFDYCNNVVSGFSSGGSTSYNGATSEDNHTHPWIMTPAGDVIIGEANSHDHSSAVISKKDQDEFKELLKEITKSAVEDGTKRVDKKETDMTDTKTAAEIQKAADEKLAKVQAELDTATKVNSLNIVAKAHYDTLGDEDKTSFLTKSDEDQANAILVAKQAAEDKNPVVYKSEDGSEFRKNDDPRLVQMAKRDDKREKEMAALRKTNDEASLRKRAEDMLSNLTGTTDDHMAMLKAAESIEDGTQRESAINALKSHNIAMGKAYDTLGSQIVPEVAGTAEADLNAIAKVYQKDHAVTAEVAMAKVLEEDPEAQRLYAEKEAAHAKTLN